MGLALLLEDITMLSLSPRASKERKKKVFVTMKLPAVFVPCCDMWRLLLRPSFSSYLCLLKFFCTSSSKPAFPFLYVFYL